MKWWLLTASYLVISSPVSRAELSDSFGLLQDCDVRTLQCTWNGRNDQPVTRRQLIEQLLEDVPAAKRKLAALNAEEHATFMEETLLHARKLKHEPSYQVGLSKRHLYEKRRSSIKASDIVISDMESRRITVQEVEVKLNDQDDRKLQVATQFNWCDDTPGANPANRDICSPVKSQQQCGSCWAFAATDAIESAVSLSSNGSALPLSPQQFLECSHNKMSKTFSYCWAETAPGYAPWLKGAISWSSDNNGCDGGMTHGAFDYAAYPTSTGLVSELSMPYTEDDGDSKGKGGANNQQCDTRGMGVAASIRGWAQVVGRDCSRTRDIDELLKGALQVQPIAVAINAQGNFRNYKGGMYTCPNNGNFPDHSMIDHALMLVGYGTDPVHGDYWLLKNSYGTAWGDGGFMRLKADKKINCGVSIYPVAPLQAVAGVTEQTLDGGGDAEFAGLSFQVWFSIGVAASVITVVLLLIGALYSRRRALEMKS